MPIQQICDYEVTCNRGECNTSTTFKNTTERRIDGLLAKAGWYLRDLPSFGSLLTFCPECKCWAEALSKNTFQE